MAILIFKTLKMDTAYFLGGLLFILCFSVFVCCWGSTHVLPPLVSLLLSSRALGRLFLEPIISCVDVFGPAWQRFCTAYVFQALDGSCTPTHNTYTHSR